MDTGRIRGDRLLAKDVFAGIDRRREMHRAKARRSCQDHNIDIGVDDFSVSIQPYELTLLVDLYPARNFRDVAERSQGLIDLRLIDFGDRGQFGIIVRVQGLARRAGSAAATTYQANFQRVRHGLR